MLAYLARLKWLGLIALGITFGVLGLRMIEARLIFFPMRGAGSNPRDIGLAGHEDVSFLASDGVRLHGWFIPRAGATFTLLFCHGNAGHIGHRLEKLRLLHAIGLQVFIFDYRGYGLSEGNPSEAGVYRDALAAYQYLMETRHIPETAIIAFGESLGGAVAVELATRTHPAALIVEDTFTSVRDMARLTMPWVPSWLLSTRFDSRAKMARLTLPKLLMHSVDDEIVPFALGQALYDAASPPKQQVKLRGGHNTTFLDSGPQYSDALRAFVESL